MAASLIALWVAARAYAPVPALGWAAVFALSRRFGDVPNTWALIPALVMAVVGTLLLSAGVGERVLGLVGTLWPLALVAFGGYLVVRTQR